VEKAEQFIQESVRAQNSWQQNRINPFHQSKAEMMKAWKAKGRLTVSKRLEAERNKRLQEIRG
jgi:hypothetical protein